MILKSGVRLQFEERAGRKEAEVGTAANGSEERRGPPNRGRQAD